MPARWNFDEHLYSRRVEIFKVDALSDVQRRVGTTGQAMQFARAIEDKHIFLERDFVFFAPAGKNVAHSAKKRVRIFFGHRLHLIHQHDDARRTHLTRELEQMAAKLDGIRRRRRRCLLLVRATQQIRT